MMYRVVDLILKKRNNHELTKDEIDFLISLYIKGNIPDYQMSALLMAIYFNPLSFDETINLTDSMLNSGEKNDLSKINGVTVDKHSTGGVGDKTSLVVGPMAASLGIKIAKMSGRGLGQTGGTLDKLEAIPGFKIEMEPDQFFKQVNEIGISIIGQSQNIVPADKKLYALRDVTGTIESLGLIASSIMSKKLASGADHIVLDVKVGKGAFMTNLEMATDLAKLMVKIGKRAHRDTSATLTNMDQPLGCAVGNSLEIIEAIETLKGNGPKDFTELCVKLTAEILIIAGIEKEEEAAIQRAEYAITSGIGLNKLKEMIAWQGGDTKVIDDYSIMGTALEEVELFYEFDKDVYVEGVDAHLIGEASVLLGAGREKKEDSIDHAVGIVVHKKIGDQLHYGDKIATIYSNGKNTELALKMVMDAYTLTNEEVKAPNVIYKIIR